MKKWVVAFVMVMVLIPLQVKAFDLTYQGRKDVWIDLQYFQSEDEAGQIQQRSAWNFGHSLEFSFNGYGEDGYLMGYLTDQPEQMNAVYLDAVLGDYKLEWTNYNQAFQIPTWFNLRQEFRGARFGYLGMQDRLDLLGVRGENYQREETWVLEPGDEALSWALRYGNIDTNSVRIWVNGEELTYGADFYVLPAGVISFKIPFKESSQVYIRYTEEGMGYLVYGGRYERFFQLQDDQNLAGSLVYLHNQDLYGQNLIGTEWIYQPKPWWSMDLSLGAVQQKPMYYQNLESGEVADSTQLTEGLTDGTVLMEPGTREAAFLASEESFSFLPAMMDGSGGMMPGDGPGRSMADWDLNWRIGQQVHWQGMELGLDYQMIRNNFQNLLYTGKIGELLNLFAGYQNERMMVNYSQFYNWDLEGQLDERRGSFEFHWANPHWAHLSFSQYQKGTSQIQQGYAEVGYLTENDWGMLNYILGVDVKQSGEAGPLLAGALPYLKFYYEKLDSQNLEAKFYGQNNAQGLELTRLQLNGKWNQGPVNWKGELNLAPDYYRTNHVLQWVDLPTNLSLNLVQNRYFHQNQNYLSADLQVDLTALLAVDTTLRANVVRDETPEAVNLSYSLGGERAIVPGVTLYGDLSLGAQDESRTYAGGVRGIVKQMYGWDVNYSWSAQPRGEELTDLIQHTMGFSFGSEDDLMISGWYETNNEMYSERGLKLSDFVMPRLKLNLSYTGKVSEYTDSLTGLTPWSSHQLNLGTAYHF